MNEIIVLIDEIIKEHVMILQRVQTLEQVANDAEALVGLEKAKDAFIPGRLEHKQSLQKFEDLLGKVFEGLQAHFNREETRLLTAFEKQGGQELVTAFRALLLEHEDLRQRFNQSREDVAKLMHGKMSRHVWEASAHDMRAHITHTRKLLEAHARIEQELLHSLRKQLEGKK